MLTPSPLADSVVRAAAWDDGGAEFIFSDGTIMSFVDNMNTFVAVRSKPSAREARRAATHAARQRQQEERRQRLSKATAAAAVQYVDSINDPQDDDDDNRELCFTAWTLSRDVGKVRAALHIFNSLSEQPRLLTPLLPSEVPAPFLSPSLLTASASSVTPAYLMVGSCGVWQEPGPPIDTLLLERRADLFRRHVVLGTVREWRPVSAAVSQRQPGVPSAAGCSLPRSASCLIDGTAAAPTTLERATQLRVAERSPARTEYGEDSSVAPPKEVPVGTVLELWCALRRVCMTVAVHRETFTVRWPAPVTRSDGSRLPPSFHARDTAAWHLLPVSPSWSARISTAGSASAPLLFTYMEQTFPVRDPPDAWRTMLQLALQLDAELPGAEKEGNAPSAASASPSHTTVGALGTDHDGNAGRSASWHGCLPEPHRWSGALNQHCNTNPCRFSRLTASQAAHLAAPRTTRAVDAMRELHPRGTRLCWMYEANHCGASRESPSAVYWCLRGSAVTTPITGNLSGTAVTTGTSMAAPLRGTEVVAWVAEDGSVVRTTLEGQGYTVRHHRLHLSSSCVTAPAPAVYRLQAHDTAAAMAAVDKRLPSTITPLRCHVHVSPQSPSTPLHNGGEVLQSCCALSPSAMRHLCGEPNSRSSPRGNAQKKAAAAAAASAVAAASPEAFAVAVIDPQSLYCLLASSTDGLQRGCTAATITPACVCSAVAALNTTLVSSEQRFPGYMDSHCNAAAGALSFASMGRGVTCGRVGPLQANDAVRRLRFGRYIASVVDVAIQLSQVNCAAQRAADADRLSTDPPRLAAYCGAGPAATSPSCLSPSAHGLSCRKGARSAAATTTSRSASAASVVYLTSRLDGIGTFTALTNGTIRVHFDDRTLLTLIPGVNEVDEEELLATCVLRNATRCTMRAAQCHPGHAMHRYLAYALPFRRYVYWRAVNPHELAVMDGGCTGVSSSERHATALQAQPQQRQRQSPSAAVMNRVLHTTARDDPSASLTSVSAMEAGASLMEPPLVDESVCLLPSLRSCSLATSFSVPGDDDDDRVATVLSKAVRAPDVKSEPPRYPLPSDPTCSPRVCLSTSNAVTSQGNLNGTGPAWGLVDTQRTVQTYYDAEVAEAAAQQVRLQELLDQNEALSKSTRALLRT
ncbi:conserved hypothetical protein [Leishmania major strain Friedlin]|uniref:C5orf34-like C-terminal domain-containing protein n=1 Tax=Leishmania major TaxID=5664 RepID=Q4Q3R0_LEIMA|nr:conserved hypothetical protein [Leishmania major strain Friedlin]CAG9580937.1 Domain_of_unknown_function_(DUF4520)_-_putative [Leishmania major strain Friedlin]CAJ06771.1 conserved hypothetical protein [Leishmania major strain Friedlin]|eukprot:XP_001686038.1 conserved hypothetical protein [Leishmania major strain Friedlin]